MVYDNWLTATFCLPIVCGDGIVMLNRIDLVPGLLAPGMTISDCGIELRPDRSAILTVKDADYSLACGALLIGLTDTSLPRCATADEAIAKYAGEQWTVAEVVPLSEYDDKDHSGRPIIATPEAET